MMKVVKKIDVLLFILGIIAIVLSTIALGKLEKERDFYSRYDTEYEAEIISKKVKEAYSVFSLKIDLGDRLLITALRLRDVDFEIGENIQVYADKADLSDIVYFKPNNSIAIAVYKGLITSLIIALTIEAAILVTSKVKMTMSYKKEKQNKINKYENILICCDSFKNL